MKILIVSPEYYPEISGCTTSLYNRICRLVKKGCEIKVLIPDYSIVKHLYPHYQDYIGTILPKLTVDPFPSKTAYVKDLVVASPISKMVISQKIMTYQPDLIHIESPERIFLGLMSCLATKELKLLKLPSTAFFHTFYLKYVDSRKNELGIIKTLFINYFLRHRMASIYNTYDKTLVQTETVANYITQHYGIKNVIHQKFLGIDKGMFSILKNSTNAVYSLFADKVKILFSGRLAPEKNLSFLLEVYNKLRKCNRCVFIFMGDGPDRNQIQQWAAGYSDTVLTGWIQPNELMAYYQQADIMVSASLTETLGLSILEGCASGLPAVVMDSTGTKDIVFHQKTGFLVAPGDKEGFYNALQRLINDPVLRKKMGQEAQKFSEEYDWDKVIQNWLSIWTQSIKHENH